MEDIRVSFELNGKGVEVKVAPNRRLLDVLRVECGCKSVKEGCSEGECGACTVIRNGKAMTSCCILIGQVNGDRILTTEGLVQDGRLGILQQAFVETGAVQCGFCTPGMLMSAAALLEENPAPTEVEIRRAIAGNLCRCTGYAKIVQAISLAAERKYGGIRDE